MVSSLRSYFSLNVSNASTKCCWAVPPLLWRVFVCSSMMILVSWSRCAPCLAKVTSSRGNIHRSQGMCSAVARVAPNFRPLAEIALNSVPWSSSTPSEFMNRFPNVSLQLVMLLNATAPKYFLTDKLFPKCSALPILKRSDTSLHSLSCGMQKTVNFEWIK